MKIGCLQLSPGKGELNSNISRVDAVLQKGIPDQLDLLVLPELAFSGTGFKSSCEALPHVESTASGISPIWAKAMALKHDCTVVIGYPERERSQLGRESVALYNSLAVVNNDGELLSNYRAVHLQPGDEYWAQESRTGFHSEWIPGFGQMVLGLSMDINSRKFQEPWSDFSFAFHVLRAKANVVILSMAWPTAGGFSIANSTLLDPDMDTLAYWVSRLEPIIRADTDNEILVVFANRCGTDQDVTYSGTSAVLGICDGEVTIYGILGYGETKLLMIDTEEPPLGKLVYQPTTNMAKERKAQEQGFLARIHVPKLIPSSNSCIQWRHNEDESALKSRSKTKTKLDEKNVQPSQQTSQSKKKGSHTPHSKKPTSVAWRANAPKLSLITSSEVLAPKIKIKSVHTSTPINPKPRNFSALAGLRSRPRNDLVEVDVLDTESFKTKSPLTSTSAALVNSGRRTHTSSKTNLSGYQHKSQANASPTARSNSSKNVRFHHGKPNMSPTGSSSYKGSLASSSTYWGHSRDSRSRISGSEGYLDWYDHQDNMTSARTSVEGTQFKPGFERENIHRHVQQELSLSSQYLHRSKSRGTSRTGRGESPRSATSGQRKISDRRLDLGRLVFDAKVGETLPTNIQETGFSVDKWRPGMPKPNNNLIPIVASPSIWSSSTNVTTTTDRRTKRTASAEVASVTSATSRSRSRSRMRLKANVDEASTGDLRIQGQRALREQIGTMRARSASQTRAQMQPIQRLISPPLGIPASAHPDTGFKGRSLWTRDSPVTTHQVTLKDLKAAGEISIPSEWPVHRWMRTESKTYSDKRQEKAVSSLPGREDGKEMKQEPDKAMRVRPRRKE